MTTFQTVSLRDYPVEGRVTMTTEDAHRRHVRPDPHQEFRVPRVASFTLFALVSPVTGSQEA